MLTELREKNILRLLHEKQFVKVNEIMIVNDSSISTVRRDLQRMESQGKLTRIYGGARLETNLQDETDFTIKSKMNLSEKDEIGKAAAKTVQENEVIFLDAGTSTSSMVRYLADIPGLLVVTNGLTIASLLSDFDIDTYMVGGHLKNKTRALIGSEVNERIETFQFDRCFMGANGVSMTQGFTTPDIQEAQIKTAVIKQSRHAYVLVDQSKFEQISFVKFADLTDARIVTDHCPKAFIDDERLKIMEVRE